MTTQITSTTYNADCPKCGSFSRASEVVGEGMTRVTCPDCGQFSWSGNVLPNYPPGRLISMLVEDSVGSTSSVSRSLPIPSDADGVGFQVETA